MVVSPPSNCGSSSVSNCSAVGSTSSEKRNFMAVSGRGLRLLQRAVGRVLHLLLDLLLQRVQLLGGGEAVVDQGARNRPAGRARVLLPLRLRRYSRSSSDMEWEYGRTTWACSSAGPLRWRQ
jgi:hypothetical protein